MKADEVLRHFKEKTWTGGSFGLEPMVLLLEELGNPHEHLKFVHVTGTNGKGSTCAMIHRILLENGYKTALFTSPALFDFREQIRVNTHLIPFEVLGVFGTQVLEVSQRLVARNLPSPSEFEMTFAVALLYFLSEKVDLCVIEVGLGGKMDATNVIPPPLVAVIGSISLDHTNLLGNSLEEIALEKSGIIKTGCHVALYEQTSQVMNVITTLCHEKNISCHVSNPSLSHQISQSKTGQVLEIKGQQFTLALLGEHQVQNLALVFQILPILEHHGFTFSLEKTQKALSEVTWGGRFEYVGHSPDFIVDGGHNLDGISTTISTLTQRYPNKKFRFLIAMLQEKNFPKVLDTLAPLAHSFVTVTAPTPRALTASQLEEYIKNHCDCPVISGKNLEEALYLLQKDSTSQDILVALGSLYMIGPLRELIFQKGELEP